MPIQEKSVAAFKEARPANQDRALSTAIEPFSADFVESFGNDLVSAGTLDLASVDRARRAAATTGERFDLVLLKLGLISEEDLAAALANFLGLPLYSPKEVRPETLLADILPQSFIAQNRVLPIAENDNRITLAVVDPFDTVPLESTKFVVNKPVDRAIITLSDFDRAFKTLAGAAGPASEVRISLAEEVSEHDLQRLRDSASEAPVVRLVAKIISDAVEMRASDIHLEPAQSGLVLRYRIDGMLRTVDTIAERSRAAVLSRVKILAKLDIAERRLPQDGRTKIAVRGSEIDFRVATIPTLNGESIVMRILDRSRIKLDFDCLGFVADQLAVLRRLITYPNGIILVTGPTGSGKTTTLYTVLKNLNQPTAKIFTVEDPIEYQLDGISQVQVQQSIGLDFPASLRAILRQDPDIIMIGEIRDTETARIAVQSSLTGHLVFSTLHTNSAGATVTRLIDMGIEHFLLGSTIRGIMGQRLVRRLCRACARPHPQSAYWAECFKEQSFARTNSASAPNFMEPAGCEECHGSGFRGRLAISELMVVDATIQQAILQRMPASEIAGLARQGGMTTMYEDGLAKAWAGLTTIEEVLRVTDVA